MGFSVRVAKGVRISASSRGVRTSVRAGPVSYSVGSSRRRSSRSSYRGTTGGSTRATYAGSQRALQEAAKHEQAQELRQAFERILNLHRQEFPPASQPVVSPPPALDESAVRKRHEATALQGIGIFKRSERAAAKERAAASAQQEIDAERLRQAAEQDALQAELDQRWQALNGNDPEAVLDTLADAFEDNEAAAAPVNVEGDEATVVMLAPPQEILPERYPTLTTAGNLTLKKLPKADRASFYKMLVCGHLLATLRETFAVAPGIRATRGVVLRASPPDAYGNVRPELLIAGRWERQAFEGVQWSAADAVLIVNDTATELVLNQKGSAKELTAVVLSKEPELANLVGLVDFAELTEG
jgi:hypothetical protein